MTIHHYEEINGTGEYIILTEDDEFDIDWNSRTGYKHIKAYEFEGETGSLPLDRRLERS